MTAWDRYSDIVNAVYERMDSESTNKTFGIYMLYRFPTRLNQYSDSILLDVLGVEPTMTELDLTVRELDLLGWYKKYWDIIIGERE